MEAASSEDASSSGVLTELVRIESKQCLKSMTGWSKRELPPHPGSSVKLGSVDTLPVKPV